MTKRSCPAARTRAIVAGGLLVAGLVAGCSSSAAPSGSAAVRSTSPSSSLSSSAASLEPVEDPVARLEARLLEIMDAPDLTYRFEQSADITSGDASLRQVSSGEVSGPDLHLTTTVTQGDSKTVTEVAILDGTAYQRDGTGPWTRSGTSTAVTSIVPQLSHIFDQSTLRYAGHVLHDGSYLQHLTLQTPVDLAENIAEWLPSSATAGTLDALDLYLESDGSPVDIAYELTFTIQPDASSDPLQLHGVYRSTYTDLGEEIPIQIDGLNLAPA